MGIDVMLRKEGIILNAIDLIDEKGIHSLSTKEISKRMQISEGTVFKHFPKKNDLMNAVLDRFSQYDSDISYSSKDKDFTTMEPIIFYIKAYLTYYEGYPAMTAFVQAYDILRKIPELEERVNNIYFQRISYLREIIEKVQGTGVLNKSVDSSILASIIRSTCAGVCLEWRMSNFNFSLSERTMQIINVLLSVFCNKKIGNGE